MIYESELYHHGILGQKWGRKNGPPYPLGSSNHSASEKKAGWRESIKKSASNYLETTKKGFKERYHIKTKKDKEEESRRRQQQEKEQSMKKDESRIYDEVIKKTVQHGNLFKVSTKKETVMTNILMR